jgi:ABC-2 type transport system ATP-binding protein
MIEAKNLTRRFGDMAAVDDVSFAITPGEVVGLLGHNGAGKTTIMKMLTGFLEPSSGEARVDGIDVQDDPLAVQAQMGYLPESVPLYPELTVAEYLTHTALLRGLKPGLCIREALEATQLNDRAFDPIHTLSRGYKQRLGVAQAILHKPRFLILDEPSNGLDPNQIQHMRSLIRRLAEEATIILSTHIMQEVNAVCDRALIVRNGRLAVDERLDALQSSAKAVLKTSPAADVAAALDGLEVVADVEHQNAGIWHIGLNGEVSACVAQIAKSLVAKEISVYSLAPEVRDLEVVFAEVNEETRNAA